MSYGAGELGYSAATLQLLFRPGKRLPNLRNKLLRKIRNMKSPKELLQNSEQQEWHAKIKELLKTRDKLQKLPFTQLIEQNSSSQSQVVFLSERCGQLEQLAENLKKRLQDQKFVQDSVNAQQYGVMERELAQLKEENARMYKIQATNAQRVLDVTDQLQARDLELKNKHETILTLSEQLRAHAQKRDDLMQLVREKESVIQLLQDELSTTQLELQQLEERFKMMENENRVLTERWLRQKNEEAEKMNQANSFYESMLEKTKALTSAARTLSVGTTRALTSSFASMDSSQNMTISKLRPSLVKSEPPQSINRHFKANDDQINALSISPDGTLFCSSGVDKRVKVYECGTLNLKYSLTGCLQSVMCTEFSSANDILLAASNDNSIRLWSVDTGRPRYTLTGHIGNVWAARFTPDAKKIISGSHDRTLKLWDLSKGSCIRSIFTVSSVNDLCITDDAGVISGHLDNMIRFWDTKTGDLVKEMSGIHAGQITSVQVSPDTYQILTCSRDNTMKLIDIRTFSVLNTFLADGFTVGMNHSKACFSTDGSYIAAGSQSGDVYIFNTFNSKTKNPLEIVLKKHSSPVITVAWHPSGKGNLYSADKGSFVSIWQ